MTARSMELWAASPDRPTLRALRGAAERVAAALALAVVLAQGAADLTWNAAAPLPGEAEGAGVGSGAAPGEQARLSESMIGGYMGVPWHNRSDAKLARPDGTDLTLKNLRWDGEPFNFPIYAGVRYARWYGPFGGMIDFLHDKAIARTGKGAHGRKVTGERAIPDTIELAGTWKGQPAPQSVLITDVLERLEFSHGHNMLLPTALVRFANVVPAIRPYAGLGAGVALPHVEVWPKGEGEDAKTNEYQLGGPAAQGVVGIEIPLPHGSIFLEYKFTYASLNTNLTGGKTPAWCNCDFVSDAVRNTWRWFKGEQPAYGHFSTTIATHQLVAGGGYRLGSRAAVAP